jgi:hypothetical protein
MPSNSNRATPSLEGSTRIWQARTDLVKQEVAAANAAADAKTARLKALRLAKEAEEAESARNAAQTAPVKKSRVKSS